ncbi:hypothetical protein HQ531_03915 [bacterium]|nr:hypothetical protein [bacterium]
MQSESDIYIEILKFGKDKSNFTYGDLVNAFPGHENLIKYELLNSRLFLSIEDNEDILNGKLALSFEDRFRLLEHEELQEARQSSRRAMCIAICSIVLSVIITFISFFTIQKVEIINSSDDHQQMIKMESLDTTQ